MPQHPTRPLLLQATTPLPMSSLLPTLRASLTSAGAWLGANREISHRTSDLHLELHTVAAQQLYIALVRCGLDLSRSAHVALATLCSHEHSPTRPLVELKLEVRSLSPAHPLTNPTWAISA